ncbi:MAG: hypothetical protein A2Y10_08535 [Planctomycetes bacterium GWF2_41_51]|nr:MAG: hypothetical protein A2Y10_08535 [Planctomycetes bacterium GWF2_41_51]HBG28580.1 hypothetical protein [Phycisphaerales bacterium]
MADTFKKVRDGEKLRIPARTYNAMVDAAADFINRKNNLTTESGNTLPANMVYIKNTSGIDVGRFNIIGISGSVIPASNPNFLNQIILIGIKPLWPNHSLGRFVITAEPISNNKIGRAYISGLVPVKIYLPNPYDDRYNGFADIYPDDVTRLRTSISPGPVTVMFLDFFSGHDGSHNYSAIVRLNYSENPVRRARCIENAPDYSVIAANLYKNDVEQTSGSESAIRVYCSIFGGGWRLDSAMPKLQTGDIIYVTNIDGKWRCLTTFIPYVSCDCDSVEI